MIAPYGNRAQQRMKGAAVFSHARSRSAGRPNCNHGAETQQTNEQAERPPPPPPTLIPMHHLRRMQSGSKNNDGAT